MITLTREEAQQVLDALETITSRPEPMSYFCSFAVEIETLRARLSAPEPEPLEYWNAVEGWVKLDEVRQHFDSVSCGTIYKNPGEGRSPLYTAPPQREWQGLTDEEAAELCHAPIAVIEAKLKAKNGF
jgi:hypothetical protein